MSSIKLVVETDLGQVDNAFVSSQNAIKGVNKEVQNTANVVKGSFASASEGTKKINKDINDTKKGIEGLTDEVKHLPPAVDNVIIKTKSLKTQLKELKAQLAEATDPKEVERLAKAAGTLADQIGDAADAAAVFATDSPFEAVGNAIGSVGSKLMNLDFKGAADQSKLLVSATKQITFKETIGSIKQIGTTLLNVGKSLLMNPLFLIGAAVTAIIANFDSLKNSGGVIGSVFKAIGKAITTVIDAGKDFLDFIGLIDSTKKSLEDLVKASELLAEQVGARYDYEIAKAKQAKKATEQLEIEKAKAQIKATQDQLKMTKKAYDDGEIDTKDYYAKVQEIGKKTGAAIINLINTQTNAQKKVDDDLKKSQDDKIKKIEEYAAKQKKIQEDLASALLDIQKRYEAAQVDLADPEEKIILQKKFADAEIKALRENLIKQNEAAGKGKQLSIKQEEQFNLISLAIQNDATEKIIQLEVDKAKKIEDIQKKQFEDSIAFQERKTKLQVLAIENQKAPQGFDEVEFEKQKQIAILKVQKQAAIESFDIKANQIDADTELLLAETENAVNEIDKKLQELADKPSKFSLASLFGIDDPKAQEQFYNDLKNIGAQVENIVNQQLDKAIANDQKQIDSSKAKQTQYESELKTLEDKLANEQKLNDDGLANNSNRTKQEIDNKNKQLEAEKQIQALALEEKKKHQKIQLALDYALQISNLAVSATNIFAANTKLSPAIGIPLSIIEIGLMFATITAAKAQALKAINSEGFAEGGYTGDGGKYTEAGIVHKGEYVITKEKTAKNRALLEGLHTDNPALIQKGIFDLLKNTGVALPDSQNINNKRAMINDALTLKANNSALNLSRVESELSEIKAKFDEVIKNQSKELYTTKDSVVKKNGTHTTITKINGSK